MKKADKIKLWWQIFFRIILLVATVISIYQKNWLNLAISLFTLYLTFLPAIIERKFLINFPSEYEILMSIFLYASLYLGEIKSFYLKYWWWDVLLHTLSGIIIGIAGFYIVYILNEEKRIAIKLSPLFVAGFAFSFAMAIGAIWEIIEFLLDQFFGLNTQKSGLMDTMGDLILDFLGALIVSSLGYLHIKKGREVIDKLFLKINQKVSNKKTKV